MNRISKKLLMGVLSVAFSLVALGTVTFAWFTLTNTATVYPIDLEISTNGGIEMAFMPLPDLTIDQNDPAFYGLHSTAAYQNEVDFEMLKDYFAEIGYDDDFEGLKNVTSSDGISFKDMNNVSVDALTGGIFKFSVVIRSLVPNQNVYLTPFTSLSSDPIEWKSDASFKNSQGVDLKPGDVVTYYAANSARMSFYSIDFDDEEVDYKFVYELPEGAYGEGFSALYGNKKQGTDAQENGTVSYYNAKHITGRITPGDVLAVKLVETKSSFLYQTPIARIPNDTKDKAGYYYTAVEIRIWLEGWDADNIDAIIQSQIRAQIQFTTEFPTGYTEEVYLENAEGEFELASSPVEHLAPVGKRVTMDSVVDKYSANYELVTSKLEGVVNKDELLVLSQTFRRKQYEIKVFNDEENIDIENPDGIRKFKFGTKIDLADLDEPAGYRLALFNDESLEDEFISDLMPAHVLIATFVRKQITVKFESNGEIVAEKVGLFKEKLALPTEDDMEKVGHSFVGWFIDEDFEEEFTLDEFPVDDVTLYAKWQVNQYTISFESDGGVEVASITQEYGTNVVPPQNPERDGFTFAGWYTDPEFKKQYIFGTMPAEDIILYARWE